MAKITSIERIWVDMPLKDVPQRNMVREIPHWSLFEICKVTLDSGHVGVGETMPYYTTQEVTDEAVARAEGANPLEVMWDDSLGCGLQMAMFDAVGQLLDTPVWALLGTKVRDWAHIGWWAIDMPVEDWISECEEAAANGYTSFKTKARPWFDLEDQVARLCAAVPDHFKIDMDFNDFGLDPAIARPLCKRLERFPHIAIWESPIAQEDVEGNRQLREHLSVPIAHHIDRPAFRTQLEKHMCDGFVLTGGISTAMRTGRICAEFNKPFWLQWVGTNLGAIYGLHIQAVLSHARWPAIHCQHMYPEQYVEETIDVISGLAHVPSRPGIGVTMKWDVVEKYRIEPKEKPYPYPELLIQVSWPNGAKTYFAHAAQMWEHFQRGESVAFMKGVHLERVHNDGSAEWKDLFNRVQKAPIHVAS